MSMGSVGTSMNQVLQNEEYKRLVTRLIKGLGELESSHPLFTLLIVVGFISLNLIFFSPLLWPFEKKECLKERKQKLKQGIGDLEKVNFDLLPDNLKGRFSGYFFLFHEKYFLSVLLLFLSPVILCLFFSCDVLGLLLIIWGMMALFLGGALGGLKKTPMEVKIWSIIPLVIVGLLALALAVPEWNNYPNLLSFFFLLATCMVICLLFWQIRNYYILYESFSDEELVEIHKIVSGEKVPVKEPFVNADRLEVTKTVNIYLICAYITIIYLFSFISNLFAFILAACLGGWYLFCHLNSGRPKIDVENEKPGKYTKRYFNRVKK